ncbi:MAG: exonuclease subunit SbcD [Proteobacteria bacterium]|nr:exonuclease subunit SbcD [Pseudomonadota bacterium]MCP4921449.1 exonuclease subunit SbcD [Pseudomonadota bacterium]
MKLLHTADWHLGHAMAGFDREHEHRRFLEWLLEQLATVDALLVAGDVFDTANPSIKAERLWFWFLATARARHPDLDIVVIAGNHDSADRMDAPNPMLEALGVAVVGSHEPTRTLQPLTRADGTVGAWVLAIPYLRISDLPRVEGDTVRDGVGTLYEKALDRARRKRTDDQALIAMGHLLATGAATSPDSERKVLGGDAGAVSPTLFPPDVAYTALGHLHLAQEVGRPDVRYSGSPIPLSMAERHYTHEVRLVELDGAELLSSTALMVPRAVDLVRIPDEGHAALAEVIPRLEALPDAGLAPSDDPYLEVRIRLEGPQPRLRERIERALSGKAVRLLRVVTDKVGDQKALDDPQALEDLEPGDVFRRLWARHYEGEPPSEIQAVFDELLHDVTAAR